MPSIVRATIIDEDDLIVVLGIRQTLEHRNKLTIDIGNIFLFTIGGYDNREEL
jgi:hypothetical protein